MNNINEKNTILTNLLIIVSIASITLFTFATILIGNHVYKVKKASNVLLNKPSDLNGIQSESGKKPNEGLQIREPINILMLGLDQRGEEISRSDTIAIYHIDSVSKNISVLAIPRDTYVEIPGRSLDKLNHAYVFGGIELTQRTLEGFLNIQIDYYVITNFAGFVNIIDQLGGITLNVEKDLKGTNIKKGIQILNGDDALEYVRNRKDPMGDIARVKRQQQFMKALLQTIKNYDQKWKLTAELPHLYKNVKTNMPIAEVEYFYSILKQNKPIDIQMEMVPGTFYNLKGISYWKPDIESTNLMIKDLF